MASSSLNLDNIPIQTLDTHKDLGVTVLSHGLA